MNWQPLFTSSVMQKVGFYPGDIVKVSSAWDFNRDATGKVFQHSEQGTINIDTTGLIIGRCPNEYSNTRSLFCLKCEKFVSNRHYRKALFDSILLIVPVCILVDLKEK